jgi:CDP-glycerol glycerophosphotransferase
VVPRCLGDPFVAAPPPVREELVRRVGALVDAYYTPWIAARCPAHARLRLELVRRGLVDELVEVSRWHSEDALPRVLIEGGRIFAPYPGFRDPRLGLPDGLFDITGDVKVDHFLEGLSWETGRLRVSGRASIQYVRSVAGDPGTELVLRGPDEAEVRLPVAETSGSEPAEKADDASTDGARAGGPVGFVVDVDPSRAYRGRPLSPGDWSAFLAVRAQGVQREVPFGSLRAEEVTASGPPAPVGPLVVAARFSAAQDLVLEVRDGRAPSPLGVRWWRRRLRAWRLQAARWRRRQAPGATPTQVARAALRVVRRRVRPRRR